MPEPSGSIDARFAAFTARCEKDHKQGFPPDDLVSAFTLARLLGRLEEKDPASADLLMSSIEKLSDGGWSYSAVD